MLRSWLAIGVACIVGLGCKGASTGTDDGVARPGWPFGLPDLAQRYAPEDVETLPEDADFVFGVGSGDAQVDAVVFWTRYLGSGSLRFAAWPTATDELDAWLPVSPADGEGIVKERIAGLKGATSYTYAFVVTDGHDVPVARSPLGRTETAWPPGTLQPLRFLASGDADGDRKPFSIFDAIAAETASFFVFNGDTVYADGSTTLEEYRSVYQANWEDSNLQNAIRAHGFYSAWDDHEVVNDWVPGSVPEEQLAAATRAFLDYHPIAPQPDGKLWRSFRWGDTAEFFVLDCRGERDPAAQRYLSAAQMQWLQQSLADSDAVFKFIVNSVPIASFVGIAADDRWEGYPAARGEILDFIASEGVANVYWLSADFHAAIVAQLPETPGSRDFVMGPLAKTLVPAWDLVGLLSHIEYASGQSYNYFVFEADPATQTLHVTVKDTYGVPMFEGSYDGVN